MKQNGNLIARKVLAVLTILSSVSVYARVVQCKNCHDWIDESNVERALVDMSTGFYCNKPECQKAREKESKGNVELFGEAVRHTRKMAAEAKERDRLCQTALDEFLSKMKKAQQDKVSAKVMIPFIEKSLSTLQDLKKDKKEYLSRDAEVAARAMSKVDFYPAFWRAVVLYGDMDVIRHFWPKVVNAKQYVKYYNKYSSRHKTGIGPFALGTDPTENKIIFCDNHANQIFLDLIKIGDVAKLAYFMEQCSPNSNFIITDFLAKVEGKDSEEQLKFIQSKEQLEFLQSKYAEARNNIERNEYKAKIKQCEADMVPKFEIHPAAWQFIIQNLSENAYTDIILSWNPDKIYHALCIRWQDTPSGYNKPAQEYVSKKMLQTPAPQLNKYNAYLKFLQKVKDAEKNAGFFEKIISAPDYPVEVRVSAQGDRLNKRIIIAANAQNPLYSGYVFTGEWVWKAGLMHKHLPYRSRKEENRWDWVPGLASSTAPGYLSGTEEFSWVWTPGIHHPHIKGLIADSSVDTWKIIPGYIKDQAGQLIWQPGTKHPSQKGMIASEKCEQWEIAPGYQKRTDGICVWCPGILDMQTMGRVSTEKEGTWKLLDGFQYDKSGKVIWVPGMKHNTLPHIVTGKERFQWIPASGFKWAHPENEDDMSVISTTGDKK